jgi:GR25 family glycosyltransferase involved in LPS biosynthesis
LIRTAIITAPRPRSTLADSVRSYRRAGFDNDVLVYSDGGETVVADKVHVIRNEVRLGNKLNWIRALSTLVSSYASEGGWLMVCEDDITWAQGAAQYLDEALEQLKGTNMLRTAGVLSLYAPRRATDILDGKGKNPLKPGWYAEGVQQGNRTWGAQCYVFSWSMAQTLLSDGQFKAIARDHRRDKNIDAFVAQCLNDRGLNVLYLIPCLVDHSMGTGNSSLGYKDERPMLTTNYFKGPRA